MTATVWVLGDQLLAEHPAVAAAAGEHGRSQVQVVLVQSARRVRRVPVQKKKLVLLFSAMRHYAAELKAQGIDARVVKADTFQDGLRRHLSEQPADILVTMAAADYPGRQFQHRLDRRLDRPVQVLPNTQFLVGRFDPYPDRGPDQKVVLEYFYREMRRHFDVLMDGDQPAGGDWNFDRQNRQPLPADLPLPAPARFEPDDVTRGVMAEVAEMPGVGRVDGFDLAVTRRQALAAFGNFLAHRLPDFGPYEDAMTARHRTLFHSVLSPYLNLGLLEPMMLVQAAERAYREGRAPINSAEGFVRQVLGWREFMYWQYWRQMPGMKAQNAWQATRPLPRFFWDGQTKMNCLHHAIESALASGYAHHIERLMLLSNFALLAGLEPAAVNDWFQACFVDAYEWVMLPNVIGMGLNADGGRTATKPYIASANYINKMSDYCAGCRYDHRQRHGADACPFNFLYWHFLLQHEDRLRANPRLGPNVLSLRHLDDPERAAVRAQAADFLAGLDPAATADAK